MIAKQSIRKGVWHIGGKYKRAKRRKQKVGAIPIGLIASLAAPVLGEIAKPIFDKTLGRGKRSRCKRW